MTRTNIKNINKYSKPVLAGVLGMLGLIVIYVSILYIATKDIQHIVNQFIAFKYWITALVLGFGLQMSLFWYIRSGMHLPNKSYKTALAAGASTSTAAMVACCAHHLTDVLPILGLSAAALFLSKYQTYLFAFGLVSNIAGIMLMIYIIKTKKCFDILRSLRDKLNLLFMKKIILTASAATIVIAIFAFNERNNKRELNQHNLFAENNNFAFVQNNNNISALSNSEYQSQTNKQANVTVEVTPKQLGVEEKKNVFSVSLNTHSVDLDFDFAEIMILKDDLNNTYSAVEWTGKRGGHHINGDIVFPEIDSKAKKIELQINGIGKVNRNFEWMLN